jgi:hypothetical protein
MQHASGQVKPLGQPPVCVVPSEHLQSRMAPQGMGCAGTHWLVGEPPDPPPVLEEPPFPEPLPPDVVECEPVVVVAPPMPPPVLELAVKVVPPVPPPIVPPLSVGADAAQATAPRAATAMPTCTAALGRAVRRWRGGLPRLAPAVPLGFANEWR